MEDVFTELGKDIGNLIQSEMAVLEGNAPLAYGDEGLYPYAVEAIQNLGGVEGITSDLSNKYGDVQHLQEYVEVAVSGFLKGISQYNLELKAMRELIARGETNYDY